MWANGTTEDLLFKDLSPHSNSHVRRRARPRFLTDPQREIDAYRQWSCLDHCSMSAWYGDTVEPEHDRYWLFLRQLPGEELYKHGDFEVWKATARWLALMHSSDDHPLPTTPSNRWVRYDASYFRIWPSRALENLRTSASNATPVQRRQLTALAGNYADVVARLSRLPVTIVHGDFYPSNILIVREDRRDRLHALDWELAGIGTGLLDLAALTSGRWSPEQRDEMALAYFGSLPRDSNPLAASSTNFLRALDDVRLHLALQWLGWSAEWSPPPDHAHDWLGEAIKLGEKVGCL
jgi:Ser/Thr protein kinase RdoA (MazF antagonist)